MTNTQQYHRLYYFMGLVLDVQSDGDQLIAGLPGVPAGYEVMLEQPESDLFRTVGGQFDGSPILFSRDPKGEVTGMKVGTYDVPKISPEKLKNLPVVERLLPPEFELTPEKQSQFDNLLQISLGKVNGDWIDYNLPYPKHEFVQYVTALDKIIFHVSNNTEIDEFQPIRKSMESYDETGRGNVQGVLRHARRPMVDVFRNRRSWKTPRLDPQWRDVLP